MGTAVKKTDGNVIIIPATADQLNGDVVEFGTASIGIVQVDGLTGEDISVDTRGVYALDATVAEAFVIGDPVNWDAGTSKCLSTGDVLAGMVVQGKLADGTEQIWVKIG